MFLLLLGFALLIVPGIMMLVGRSWQTHPPSSVNWLYGYRTFRAMRSQVAWDFAQREFARLWYNWGRVLAAVSFVLIFLLASQERQAIGRWVLYITRAQLLAMLLPIIIVELALRRRFDSNGNPLDGVRLNFLTFDGTASKSRYIVIGLAMLLLLTALGVRNSKDNHLRVEEYFPSSRMTKEFSGGYEDAGFSQTVEIVENDKVQIKHWDTGTGVVTVYQISNEDIRLIYSESGDSLPYDYIDKAPNRDEIILKAPLAVGTKWYSHETGRSYEITGVNVKVITRAGLFYAVEVTHTSAGFESKSYYAKNIGLVKRSMKGYGSDNLMRLKIEPIR